jgi:hypothetical protein
MSWQSRTMSVCTRHRYKARTGLNPTLYVLALSIVPWHMAIYGKIVELHYTALSYLVQNMAI